MTSSPPKESPTASRLKIGRWASVLEAKLRTPSSDTSSSASKGVVLLQGKYEKRPDGRAQVVVEVIPAVVDRKIAIRKANDRLDSVATSTATSVDIGRR